MGGPDNSILCIGPPNSGKSVFAYLLFHFMRSFNDDTYLMDGDYYSPTIRRARMERFYSEDESDFIRVTPNSTKLTEVSEKHFRNVAEGTQGMIYNDGFIIIDGLGQHSVSTECLISLCNHVILICAEKYSTEPVPCKCNYLIDGVLAHPFDFYDDAAEKKIKIVTHLNGKTDAFFKEDKLYAELYGLERKEVRDGVIHNIPEETINTIKKISKYIIDNW